MSSCTLRTHIPALLGCLAAGLAGIATQASAAAAASAGDTGFQSCVARLQTRAREAGVSPPVVEEVLGGVRRLDRVIELDRRQPEFTQTFARYYTSRVTEARVQRGRELLERHRELLEEVQHRYGVPAHYLVAFWGLETNFGRHFGKMPVPDSLATLACDERRSSFFTRELISALRIIDAGDIEAQRMEGSWAGAMGHLQFLPSVFLEHAVDADGDGRRDLWGSVRDVMASAGSFLESLGWVRGLRWGREARLPEDFDYALAGREHRRPLAEWRALGVTDAFGRALPRLDLPASVVVPAGHEGPAFLVYENFDVIMGWNRSEYYALAVGRLADRIAGGGPLRQPLPDDDLRLSRASVERMQRALAAGGFDPGEVDGVMGSATRAALRRFQEANGLVPDGHPDRELLAALGVAIEDRADSAR